MAARASISVAFPPSKKTPPRSTERRRFQRLTTSRRVLVRSARFQRLDARDRFLFFLMAGRERGRRSREDDRETPRAPSSCTRKKAEGEGKKKTRRPIPSDDPRCGESGNSSTERIRARLAVRRRTRHVSVFFFTLKARNPEKCASRAWKRDFSRGKFLFFFFTGTAAALHTLIVLFFFSSHQQKKHVTATMGWFSSLSLSFGIWGWLSSRDRQR